MSQLSENSYGAWLEVPVSFSSGLGIDKYKTFAHNKTCSSLKFHPNKITFEVFYRVTIVIIYIIKIRHFELGRRGACKIFYVKRDLTSLKYAKGLEA